jgi:hypothetical protein
MCTACAALFYSIRERGGGRMGREEEVAGGIYFAGETNFSSFEGSQSRACSSF